MASHPPFDRVNLANEISLARRQRTASETIEWLSARHAVEVKVTESCIFLRIGGILATSVEDLENALDNWCLAVRRRAGASRGGIRHTDRIHRALPTPSSLRSS